MTKAEIIKRNEQVMEGWFRYVERYNGKHPYTTAICFEMGEDCTPETECPLAALCSGNDADAKEALAKKLVLSGEFQLD